MAAVYKSMAKAKPNGISNPAENGDTKPKNRQRVLILTSRGVTYRYATIDSSASTSAD